MFLLLFAPPDGILADSWQKNSRNRHPYDCLDRYPCSGCKPGSFFEYVYSVTDISGAGWDLFHFFALNLPVGLTIGNDVITPGLIDVSQYKPKEVPSLTWCDCIKKIWKQDPNGFD